LESLPDVAETQVRLPDGSPLLVNAADTLLNAFMVTVQVAPETASHPLQLVKLDPVAGAAVRVTTAPLS